MSLETAAYDYHLPPECIAQQPVEPRDASRLLVLHRATGRVEHRRFRDLPEYLEPGDLLVANDSEVIPARLKARKETGGLLDLLLLRPLSADQALPTWVDPEHPVLGTSCWLALVGGRVRPGTRFRLEPADGPPGQVTGFQTPDIRGEVVACAPDGQRLLCFDQALEPWLAQMGELPLPPYIQARSVDPGRYQTVYARRPGSAAAPTAGLHFTPDLLATLAGRGVAWQTVTLHVGLDTFRPVAAEHLVDHDMHAEWASLGPACSSAIADARRRGGRVVAVGTTAVRVLETAGRRAEGQAPPPFEGWTDLFLYPGQPFLTVDALVTNFHLPRSSLLMLISAFAGRERVLACYQEAIRLGYRFFSFGDAMLIL